MKQWRVVILCLMPCLAFSEGLDLMEDTLSVMGKAQIDYHATNIGQLGRFYTNVDFGLGYFVLDNLMVDGRFIAGFLLGSLDSYTNSNGDPYRPFNRSGFSLGLTHFFDTEDFFTPYIGLSAGILYSKLQVPTPLPTGPTYGSRFSLSIEPTFGLLLALSHSYALNFGVSSEVDIPLSVSNYPVDSTSLRVAVGHIGFNGFF